MADAVGRSKAGLLHHFDSRETLLLEIVRHRDAVNRQQFPATEDPGFQASRPRRPHNATVPGLVALFAVTSALAAADTSDTERRRYFTERYARTRAGFARRIARAQEGGALRTETSPRRRPPRSCSPPWTGCRSSGCWTPGSTWPHLRTLVLLLEGPCRD